MPETTEPEALGALPRFDQPSPLDPPTETVVEEEIPSRPPPTTSIPPKSPPEGPQSARSGTSSTASSEPPEDVAEAFVELGKGIAAVIGLIFNRVHRRLSGRDSQAWLMTEDECNAIGGALGSMAARRVPAEVAGGDGADAITAVGAALPYVARNVMPAEPRGDVVDAESYDPEQAPGPTVAPPPVITPDL